ncbi:hypothetical protein [Alkalibacter mobilis]|uniref:hypothetical protein n=1 Tax=Alkalibacter mobilis TaxID=2787712 RepID=UPI0018A0907D|nr:hypothetical protein [Alkalibacter mobilis]MBF7096432.1 hypothetical protein [Alkalibacter mobilis]
MKYYAITAVIFILGFIVVTRMSNMIYKSQRYKDALDRKFNFDEICEDNDQDLSADKNSDDDE